MYPSMSKTALDSLHVQSTHTHLHLRGCSRGVATGGSVSKDEACKGAGAASRLLVLAAVSDWSSGSSSNCSRRGRENLVLVWKFDSSGPFQSYLAKACLRLESSYYLPHHRSSRQKSPAQDNTCIFCQNSPISVVKLERIPSSISAISRLFLLTAIPW